MAKSFRTLITTNFGLSPSGFTGSRGNIGPSGYTGSLGSSGFTGSIGPLGYTGSGSGGSTSTEVSSTAPMSPSEGDLWLHADTGELSVYFGNAWAAISSGGGGGSVGFTGSAGTNGTTGFTGSAGTNGTTGFTGSAGGSGSTGFTGSAGTNGSSGSAGGVTYTVVNSGASAYTIAGQSNPTLTLLKGFTYYFEVSAAGHPFWIKTSQTTGTGDAYNSGVTNNGTASGTVTFTVPFDAPATLYYICQFHSSMVGTINTAESVVAYNVNTTNSGFLAVPTGNTAQRPASPANGYIRYNTTTGYGEIYNASLGQWLQFGTPPTFSVEYLVVAGGGGGGKNFPGGGAGGYSVGSASISTGSPYTVTIGGGGAGATVSAGGNGSSSIFSTVTSVGGGGGFAISGSAGGNGGSGGAPGGLGTAGQGFNAGTNSGGDPGYGGGGGGGAGGAGANGTSTSGGAGGVGLQNSISGSATYYAGGGGGGVRNTGGTAGLGGLGATAHSISGWKICLNVTEQLIGDYSIMDQNVEEIYVPSIFMVDCDRDRQVDTSVPLYKQKFHGFSFRDSDRDFLERRSRRLHRTNRPYPTSSTAECMAPGRHYNMYSNNMDLAVLYYGWCPFDQGQLKRKLQIQTQIPLIDRQRGWGFHHITNAETLTYRLENEFIPRARNISEEINYYVNKHENFSNLL